MFVVTDGINAGGGSRYSGSVATKIPNITQFLFFLLSFSTQRGSAKRDPP